MAGGLDVAVIEHGVAGAANGAGARGFRLRQHGNDPRRSSDDTLVSDRKVPTPAGLVGRLARIRDLETRQGVVA